MPSILVIEDNTQMRSALTRMLETSGHRVTAAATAPTGSACGASKVLTLCSRTSRCRG